MLTELIKSQIKDQASKSNEESVGVLIDCGQISYVSVKNNAVDKKHYFSISGQDYLKLTKLGKIIAVCHSHEEREDCSGFDLANVIGHKLPFIIYCKKTDTFSIIDKDNKDKYYKYLGKEFKIGSNDCFGLVREFYKKELSISIKDVNRSNFWYEERPNLITEEADNQGFKLYNKEEGKKINDILIYSFDSRRFPMHLAIYVGGDEILHHPRNSPSLIERTSELENNLVFIARHG